MLWERPLYCICQYLKPSFQIIFQEEVQQALVLEVQGSSLKLYLIRNILNTSLKTVKKLTLLEKVNVLDEAKDQKIEKWKCLFAKSLVLCGTNIFIKGLWLTKIEMSFFTKTIINSSKKYELKLKGILF